MNILWKRKVCSMNWQAVKWHKYQGEWKTGMLRIETLDSKEETLALYQRLSKKQTLPLFLYDDSRYRGIAAALTKGMKRIGLGFGVMQQNDPRFYLHYLNVAVKDAGESEAIFFMETFFRMLRRTYGAQKLFFTVDQNDMSKPALLQLMEKIPGCSLDNLLYVQQFGMLTKDFDYLRQFHWYCPGQLERKQCSAVLWKDFDGGWKEKLCLEEQKGELEEDYLSPGVWEKEWNYDSTTSYVLLKQGRKEPLGWIVTEQLSEDSVRIRRFYIYKEARKLLLGPAFSTWVLDRISQKYEKLSFEVVPGNRQMEMFAFKYCKPILTFNYIKCNITITLKEDKTDEMDTGKYE